MYNLKAVVTHSGTAEVVHYVLYAYTDYQWWKYDDSVVTKVLLCLVAFLLSFQINQSFEQMQQSWSGGNTQGDELSTSNAYMVFYSRETTNINYKKLPNGDFMVCLKCWTNFLSNK